MIAGGGRKEVRVERLAWDGVEPEGMRWFLFRRRGSLIYGLPMCTVYTVQSVLQEE